MDLLAEIALVTAAVAFMLGCLITAASGSVRKVKIFLGILTLIFGVGFVAGLIFSRGLLVFFLFHIIALLLILFVFVIVGAACGAGIYMYRHKKPLGKSLGQQELEEYLPALEFATREGLSEDRAQGRILSGYYRGGLYEGAWYIHKSELTNCIQRQ